MVRNSIILIAAALLATSAQGQSFHTIARNTADSVVLRWAPASVEAWLMHNTFGYRVERLEITPTTSRRSKAERIGPDSIRPLPLDGFIARFPKDHPSAGAMAQMLHGNGEQLPSDANNIMGAAITADGQRMRWSVCLLLSDLDPAMAQAAGLRCVDRTAKPGATYLYRVIALHPQHGDTAIVGVNRAMVEPLPDGPELRAEELERRVQIGWLMPSGLAAFSGYWVERSPDGRTWSRLHRTPFVPSRAEGDKSDFTWFNDTSLTRNYQAHHYRVLGITPFGEVSGSGPTTIAMGRDRTPPTAPVLKGAKDEKGRLVVHWEQSQSSADLRGYRVEKAVETNGAYWSLHTDLLPIDARSFTDTSRFLAGGNHYRVAALDTAGNIAYSMSGYGFLMDSIAPAPPIGLIGSIDTSGVVTVRWRLGKEPDILGYRVFFANATDHEFNNQSPEPFADTVFTDTLQMNTLTKRIHYKVVAVDRNYNHSPMSTMLTLTRPDLIPPVAPVFKNYVVSDTAVVIHFIPSSSKDVARHRLMRKSPGEASWKEVLLLTVSDKQRVWTDRDVRGPAHYSYTMVAVDSAGNASTEALPLAVRVHERLKRAEVTGVKALRIDERTVQVSWSQPPGTVHHYLVLRAKDGGAAMPVGSAPGSSSSFADIRLAGKGTYTYTVQAVYDDGAASAVSIRSAPLDMR
ncbi:MAG: fibronectin type III domain-containing protein [Flavobacteriales bacterium]|nr:fibronectin type III domain-containing protein [Flavobacteriales bacterium]